MKQNLTAAERKAETMLAFARALAAPDGADWRGLAQELAALVPKARAAKGAGDAAAWGEYKVPRTAAGAAQHSILARFADGREARCSFWSIAGKPWNIGRAIRAACEYYRVQALHHVERLAVRCQSDGGLTLFRFAPTRRITVPEFVSVHVVGFGQPADDDSPMVDVASINEATAGQRAGAFLLADYAGATPEALRDAFMAATGATWEARREGMTAWMDVTGRPPNWREAQWAREQAGDRLAAELSEGVPTIPRPTPRDGEDDEVFTARAFKWCDVDAFREGERERRRARVLAALEAFYPIAEGLGPEHYTVHRRREPAPTPASTAKVIPFAAFASRMLAGASLGRVAA